MAARVDHAVTSGTFSLDGQTFDVDNNVWVIGDDTECVVIDAPHDVDAILRGGRRPAGRSRSWPPTPTTTTYGWRPTLAQATGAPVLLHPADRVLWDLVHPGLPPDGELHRRAGDRRRRHRRCRCCTPPATAPARAASTPRSSASVFTGDTLFAGGPGATGRSFSDFDTIVASIRTRLLTLPPETVVHTGHGGDTTIGAEAPHLQEWLARGH